MGSIDSAFGGDFAGNFEPDDFYESFLAPKFHDFTAPEEPIDPDAYFMAKPGMLKKAFTVEDVKTIAPKIHKVAAQDAPKTAPMSHQQPTPKTPAAAEKAVSAGSAKKGTRLATLTPLTSKSMRNGDSTCNSPAQLPVQEKLTNGSLKPSSLAKKLQASENDDPNSPTNNSTTTPGNTPSKAANHVRKAHEEKPALTRQRSQKLLEVKQAAVDAHSVQKVSGDTKEISSYSDKGTPLRRENGGVGAVKALKLSSVAVCGSPAGKDQSAATLSTCKTPVKDPVSTDQEAKKAISCTEVVGSPYSGHHCKSARCAANDPNFSSPVPTKKYLIAKRNTPGSIRKPTPNHVVVEKSNGKASSESAGQSSDESGGKQKAVVESTGSGNLLCNGEGINISVEAGVTEASAGRDGSKGRAQVALVEVFQKMALDHHVSVDVDEPVVTQAPAMSNSENEALTDIPLVEERRIVEPAQSISTEDDRESSGRPVSCEEKAESCSESTATNADAKSTGMELFLEVASDCLENIDLNKLVLPQSKHGVKRKSGDLVPAGASKRANCAKNESKKAISKKISQARELAASKVSKMRLRRLSVARRVTNPRVTNPRPFRLRTQERGAVKEKEFIKKVEEYKAAKEGFHSAFQGLAVAELKIPGKFLKSGHVFSAKRADPKSKDESQVEAKATKSTVPPPHRAPLFDHPFKPHRSTKKLTVPQEPKFHSVRGSRTCPSHMGAPM